MKYSICYSSETGNTLLLANAIKEKIFKKDIYYFGMTDEQAFDADIIYLGFWTDESTCDKLTRHLIPKIKNKKIFLFGTCGFGSEQYYGNILNNVKRLIDPSNEIIGEYMCQGKMKMSVLEKYKKQKLENPNDTRIDYMIHNFNEALNHPSVKDLETLKKKVIKY